MNNGAAANRLNSDNETEYNKSSKQVKLVHNSKPVQVVDSKTYKDYRKLNYYCFYIGDDLYGLYCDDKDALTLATRALNAIETNTSDNQKNESQTDDVGLDVKKDNNDRIIIGNDTNYFYTAPDGTFWVSKDAYLDYFEQQSNITTDDTESTVKFVDADDIDMSLHEDYQNGSEAIQASSIKR